MNETIFYVLFKSAKSFHDRMQYFKEEKTFSEYMKWQHIQRCEVEKINGPVIVENFDIKYNNLITREGK